MQQLHSIIVLAGALLSTAALADTATPVTAPDYSGTYACTGNDSHDGDFKAKMTLQRDAKHSQGDFAGYSFEMKDDHTVYLGSAAANGKVVAVTFANTDASKKDFGTGIAVVSEDKDGKFNFEKFYYEPEYKGGGHGVETCVLAR